MLTSSKQGFTLFVFVFRFAILRKTTKPLKIKSVRYRGIEFFVLCSKCWCINGRHKYTTAKIPCPRIQQSFGLLIFLQRVAIVHVESAPRLIRATLRPIPIGIQPLTQMRCWLTLRLKIPMLIEFPAELQHPPAYTPTALPYPAPAYTETRA